MSNNSNNYKSQKLRGLKRKLELIKLRGGKCEICGYNKNISVLEFHHVDPNEKELKLDIRHLSNSNLDKIEKELDKCILVCANCHREIHNPDLTIDNALKIVENEARNITSINNKSGRVCHICGKRFNKNKGEIYCSKECRYSEKHWPLFDDINRQYRILKSWEKVAKHFGTTRRVIQKIRIRHYKKDITQ